MIKIDRFILHSFGIIKESEIKFETGINTLFGLNNVGKTTLINAFKYNLYKCFLGEENRIRLKNYVKIHYDKKRLYFNRIYYTYNKKTFRKESFINRSSKKEFNKLTYYNSKSDNMFEVLRNDYAETLDKNSKYDISNLYSKELFDYLFFSYPTKKSFFSLSKKTKLELFNNLLGNDCSYNFDFYFDKISQIDKKEKIIKDLLLEVNKRIKSLILLKQGEVDSTLLFTNINDLEISKNEFEIKLKYLNEEIEDNILKLNTLKKEVEKSNKDKIIDLIKKITDEKELIKIDFNKAKRIYNLNQEELLNKNKMLNINFGFECCKDCAKLERNKIEITAYVEKKKIELTKFSEGINKFENKINELDLLLNKERDKLQMIENIESNIDFINEKISKIENKYKDIKENIDNLKEAIKIKEMQLKALKTNEVEFKLLKLNKYNNKHQKQLKELTEEKKIYDIINFEINKMPKKITTDFFEVIEDLVSYLLMAMTNGRIKVKYSTDHYFKIIMNNIQVPKENLSTSELQRLEFSIWLSLYYLYIVKVPKTIDTIFFDEIFSNLDLYNINILINFIYKLEEMGCKIVIVSHSEKVQQLVTYKKWNKIDILRDNDNLSIVKNQAAIDFNIDFKKYRQSQAPIRKGLKVE